LSSQPPEQHAHPVITSTLKLLGDLVKHMQSESSHTKKLLYSVIQVCVHTLIGWLQYIMFHTIPMQTNTLSAIEHISVSPKHCLAATEDADIGSLSLGCIFMHALRKCVYCGL
jgi:hypothetical protein